MDAEILKKYAIACWINRTPNYRDSALAAPLQLNLPGSEGGEGRPRHLHCSGLGGLHCEAKCYNNYNTHSTLNGYIVEMKYNSIVTKCEM